jgi:hypothetical protein
MATAAPGASAAIAGATLASLLEALLGGGRACDGLLFGTRTISTETQLQDDPGESGKS